MLALKIVATIVCFYLFHSHCFLRLLHTMQNYSSFHFLGLSRFPQSRLAIQMMTLPLAPHCFLQSCWHNEVTLRWHVKKFILLLLEFNTNEDSSSTINVQELLLEGFSSILEVLKAVDYCCYKSFRLNMNYHCACFPLENSCFGE